MNVRIDLNEPKIYAKVTNDRFGRFVAEEWKRLIDPYTPSDTDTMRRNVRFRPFQIHYFTTGYPAIVYYNRRGAHFQTKNSEFATDHWDIKAEQAGQKDKLYRELNSALRSGRY